MIGLVYAAFPFVSVFLHQTARYLRWEFRKENKKHAFDQESDQEKKKKERKHALDQERDQEKRKKTTTAKKKK